MPTHPDADAFVRAILGNPADVTVRLAFADWLQEQGGVPNLAWAYYVRLHVEIETLEARGKKCGWLRREAAGHAAYIKGTVNIPASAIAPTHDAFQQVVPASRCTVTIGDWIIPRTVYQSMPVSLGRGSTVVPLSCRGQSIVAAADFPDDRCIMELEQEHDVEITALQADSGDVLGVVLKLLPDIATHIRQQG